ncbi:MAG: hypothetical protein JOZ22_00700, partial [Acidobacteriia bacterium]|nr:hypothetical protein [Terriglobia bacterium]
MRLWLLGAIAIAIASAQSPTQLEQQLQELKQQYAETTGAMEQRIAALEQQIQSQRAAAATPKEGTVSVEKLAKEAAEKAVSGDSTDVGATYQGEVPSEPTYDLLREADEKIEKLEDQVKGFEFHGYFRSGYGLNSDGGQQVAF